MSNQNKKVCLQPGSSSKSRIFKCTDHADSISKKLRSFYENKEFFDIVLVVGVNSAELQAHRIVLSALSDFFLGMFRSTIQEAPADKVKLKGIDCITMSSIIDFMYTGEIELYCETVESIFVAADFLQMKTLICACCAFMEEQIDVSNCLGIALFAEQHGYNILSTKASSFAFTHFDKVRAEQEFTQLNEEQLSAYLSSDDLLTRSEEDVLQSVVAWVEYDKKNREKYILNLLSHVRFTFLKPTFISTIENSYSVCNTEDCVQLIHNWLQWHMCPESRSQFSKHNTNPRTGNQKLALVSGASTRNLKVHTLNKKLNKWSDERVPLPPRERSDFSALVINTKLIIAGGYINGNLISTVECLDLQTEEWTILPHMILARSNAAMAELHGDLYVVGGVASIGWLRSVEKYNFSTRTWQEVASLSSAYARIKVAVGDGILYAANSNSHAVEYYDPGTKTWALTADKNEKLKSFGIAAVGGYLYAVGGYDDDRSSTRRVERYHHSTDTWTIVKSIKAPRNNATCVSLNNRLVTFGGIIRTTCVDIAEEYDPETNEWTSLVSMPLSYRNHFKILTM